MSPKGTLLDILVPIYGEFGLAEKAIDRVKAAAEPLTPDKYRIIAIDNGTPTWISKETHEEIAPQKMAEPVRDLLRANHDAFFRVDDNVGYPQAVNQCAERGISPLILILTSDVFLEPGAIHAMVSALDEPSIGAVGPKLLFPTDMESPHGPGGTIQHAGLAFDVRGKPYHIFIGWSADNPRANVRRDMAAVTGACFMTRRSLWQQIGGYDPRYGLGTFEDIDYCFAVRSLGKLVLFEPKAVGFHLVSGARLQGANSNGFNLPLNETIFRGKWAHMLSWDEWRYL